MDFYQPTLLFRQNAIRRSPESSQSSLDLVEYKTRNPSWIFDPNTSRDTKILNKICSLDRLNIKSNYWKIPDNNMNLTAMAIKTNDNNGTLAISSANDNSNLFIYEVDLQDAYLKHHNTISLPNIHAMKWVPGTSNLLVTGNSKGYGHLISVPEPGNQTSAEIVKRFNHRKHLRSINKDSSILHQSSSKIDKMAFNSNRSLISIYDNNLFNWDVNDCTAAARPKPVSITSINGLANFDTSPNANVLGICGRFGVSIFDLRDPQFSVPRAVENECKKTKLGSNLIKWSDDEYIFAASHLDGVIRLWDVRKQDCFGTLNAQHGSSVSSMQWVDGDLFSGGRNGHIIHWDLTSDITDYDYDLQRCGVKEGLNSVQFDPVANQADDIAGQRSCGTILPASNTSIISLETVETVDDLKVLSIDGSSFFGLHSRIYDAVDVQYRSQKLYYTHDDLVMMGERSDETLVNDTGSIHSLEKPLAITRKNTTASSAKSISRNNSISVVRNTSMASHKSITSIRSTNSVAEIEVPTGSTDTLLNMPIETAELDVDFKFGPASRSNSQSSSSVVMSPESLNSFAASFDSVATTVDEQPVPEASTHKYTLSDIQFDDDLSFGINSSYLVT